MQATRTQQYNCILHENEDFRDLHPTKATQELSLKVMSYRWIEFKHL